MRYQIPEAYVRALAPLWVVHTRGCKLYFSVLLEDGICWEAWMSMPSKRGVNDELF